MKTKFLVPRYLILKYSYSSLKIFENKVVNKGKLRSLMQLMIYIYYWLLFFKKDNFKFTTVSQRLTFHSFSLFHVFYLIVFFLIISFHTLMHKETSFVQSVSHIIYFESFCYTMYYIVLQICIGGHFLEECFYCFSQRSKFSAANEDLIPYNLMKRAPH